MKTFVVIPTYDEKDNVIPMANAVLKLHEGIEILFVDDNSPDGTGRIIDGIVEREPRVHVLHREKKEGLARAYLASFARAIELGAERIVQMDCDFSHNPADIPRLLKGRRDSRMAFQAQAYLANGWNIHPYRHGDAAQGSHRRLQVLEGFRA